MGNLVSTRQTELSLEHFFNPDTFFRLIVNPFWLWYTVFILFVFSYDHTLPAAQSSGCLVFANVTWLIYSLIISLFFFWRPEDLDSTQCKYHLIWLSTLIGGSIELIALGIGAGHILSHNSTQLLGHSMAWLGLIALPFFILFAGNFIYTAFSQKSD